MSALECAWSQCNCLGCISNEQVCACRPVEGIAGLTAVFWLCFKVACCAQVWTYHGRVAFVLSVTEKGQPIADSVKLQRLRQILFSLMDSHGEGIVNIKRVWLLPLCHPDVSACTDSGCVSQESRLCALWSVWSSDLGLRWKRSSDFC